MKLHIKPFAELTNTELYELLRARAAVFVVEQNCPYQDLDRLDYGSLHVFYTEDDGSVAACLRLHSLAGEPGTVRMGRVLTVRHGEGLGAALLRVGIETAEARLGAEELYIEAQTQAAGFYAREGFAVTSAEFLEDGIPHVQMRRKRQSAG